MKQQDTHHYECAETSEELEVKVKVSEKAGWTRYGFPYKQVYAGFGIPKGWLVQPMRMSKLGTTPAIINPDTTKK